MKHGQRWAAILAILAPVAVASCKRPAPAGEGEKQQAAIPPSIRYESHIAAGGIAPVGGTLRNPHKGDAKSAKAGEGLFVSMNCDGCHGGGAVGWVGPSLADGRWRYGGAEDEIFHSIYDGRPHGMPAFGGILPADAVWMLVTYIQSLPVPATVPTQSWVKP